MIKVNKINKYYNKGNSNEIHVIDNASLEIKETGLVAFLGKSGSGKTTLLNVIGGLDNAKGVITYENVTIKNHSVSKIDKYRKKNIGYVFQNYSLIQSQTVYENLHVSLNLIGIKDETLIDERIKCALESVGMYKYRKRLAGTLSGGQQQRVAIARALVKNAKIIIADEPTGNLDSQNTIEVLNILKQISKTKLVLLVTHDVKLASFYADRIVEIQDGKIINDYENTDKPLEYGLQDNRCIYLGDLKKEEESTSNINITKYSDDEMPSIDLKIVYTKGTVYIESPLNIKLVGANTPVRFVEGNYQKMTNEDMKTDYNFDFKEDTAKGFSLRGLFLRIWLAIKSFFLVKGKTYALYIAFIVTGMLMSLCAYNIGKYTNVDTDNSLYDKNAYFVTDKEVYNRANKKYIEMLFEENSGITKASLNYTEYFECDYKVNISEREINVSTFAFVKEAKDDLKIILGKKIENNKEIIVDKILAERIIDEFKDVNIIMKMEDLIGLFSNQYKIVGICDSGATAFYREKFYYDTIYASFQERFSLLNETPKIIIGRNIEKEGECLIPISEYINREHDMGNVIDATYSDMVLQPVGVYESEEDNGILLRENDYKRLLGMARKDYFTPYVPNKDNTKLTEGEFPVDRDEVIISNMLIGEEYSIGSTIFDANGTLCTIVGKYDTNYNNFLYLYGHSALAEAYDTFYSMTDVYVETDDFAKTKAFVEAKGYTITNTYDYNVQSTRVDTRNIGDVFFIIFLTIETVLFIYFMMRAKMISRIKTIGIYRALGARRGAIIKDFLIDLIVLTTFTTLLGYVVGSYFIVKTLSSFNIIGDIFVINIKVMVLCGVGTYIINILFGLLPIMLLLRKTPAQIIAKYDI